MNYLNLSPGAAPLVIKVSEGDIGREISFTLVEDGLEYSIPTGSTITCEILKSDGHGTSIPCTWSGSVVTLETTEQSTIRAGKATAELRIVNGADDIGTANFILAVEPRPINADTDQTDSSYSQTGDAGDVWTLGSNGTPSWSPSGLDATTATAGQAPIADGAGGWAWGRPTVVNVPVSGSYNDETEELVFENVNGTELFGIDVSEVGRATVDPTLTQSGQAADAKVTGDAINEVKADLSASVSDLKSTLNQYDKTFNATTSGGKWYILEGNSRISVQIHPGQLMRVYCSGTAVRSNTRYSLYFNRTSIYRNLYTEKWYTLRAFTEITELSFYGELNAESAGTFQVRIEVFDYSPNADYWYGASSVGKPVFTTPEVALDGYVAAFNSKTASASANYAITESIQLNAGECLVMFGRSGSNVAAISKYDSVQNTYTAVAGNAEGGCFTYTADEDCIVRLCYVKGTAAACSYTTFATTFATTLDVGYLSALLGFTKGNQIITPLDVDGKYLDKSNPPAISGYSECYMSGPIAISKGDLVKVNIYVNNETTPVAYCNEGLTSFEKIDPTWQDLPGRNELTFISDRNGYFCISGNKNFKLNNWYQISSLQTISQIQQDVATNEENVAELTENVNYVVQNKKIYQSKNLFDKNAVIDGYYISSSNGKLSTAAHASVSPLMPIEAGKVYHLFRDGLGRTHEIRFVAEDGVTPMKALQEDGTEYSSYMSANSPTVKAPEGAAYFQCTVRFNNRMDTYDSIQFEEGNTQTSYEPYVRYDYLDYTALPYGLEGLPEKVHDLETLSNVESITIANSSKIGFFSNSFLNGYTMRTHHALDNLGMWSDYIMYNYGKSGDDALECLARINDNQSFFGDVPVQDYGLTYGVIAMQDNDGALYAADYSTYYQNFKKIAEAIRAMGATPILGSEHDITTNYYGLMALAQEEGYMFMDWGKLASQLGKFTPMWHNGHPATRTAWLWTYGMLPYIENLPRPVKGIKLFRKRPDTGTTLQELVYNNVYERAERYVEIDNGYSCLTQETEKYFDRLNNGLTEHEYLKDEYQKLQAKTSSVSFGTHALVECITPYDAKNISSLKIKLNATGVTNVYMKRVLSLSNPLPAQRFVAFGVTAGANLLTEGTQFTITGGVFNDNILGTYIVDSVINGIVVTRTSSSGKTTSGTDNPTTDIGGVTLQGSYDYPSADYMQRFKQPLAEWDIVEVNTDGETDLSAYLKSHMDYDKLAILLVGNDILLSNVEFTVAGSDKKNDNRQKPIKKVMRGTSLITDSLLDDGTAWDDIANIDKYIPVTSGVDGTTREPLPTGISTVRILQSSESISQTFNTASLNQDPYHLDHVQIRVLARYFPKYVANDTDWQTTEIYEGSYDCAKMSVLIDETSDCWTGHIGAFWNEFIIDAYYQPSNRTHKLRIKCNDKSIQIAKVEMVLVED